MQKFLDFNGLSRFWQHVKAYVDEHSSNESQGVTMDQVNDAIDAAITGAIEGTYYGTENTL